MVLDRQDSRLLDAIARYRKYRDRPGIVAWALRNHAKFVHKVMTVLTGSDISREAKIARTVRFPHLTGVVIHQDAVVHDNCMIMQQVTLGQLAQAGAPVVERGAYIGSGAKILGPVIIGEAARIGANAVVLRDVPPGATAVGVPARILPAKEGETP